MNEREILEAACRHVDCTLGQVLSYHVYEDYIALVVDRGIAGGPKYKVPLAELETPEPEPEVSATDGAVRLAGQAGVDIEDVAAFYDLDRVTFRDVKRYLEEVE